MSGRLIAEEREAAAVASDPRRTSRGPAPASEIMAMLARRGIRATTTRPDVPFPSDLEETSAEAPCRPLNHYSFRLFLRGAILRRGGFAPEETTRYLTRQQTRTLADSLVQIGIARKISSNRFRLIGAARSFGGTLEWYVARELRRRLGFDVATDLKLRAKGVGGDLDIVAAAEGKLIYIELKSSPPKHLKPSELAAFLSRIDVVRPDVSLFVMDTALRLADKVVPMLTAEMGIRGRPAACVPRRIGRELWAITPHLYAVNSKPDLMSNIARAVAEGIAALWQGL